MGDDRTVETQIEYGLETIDEHRMVEVSIKDLLYVYQTLGVLVNFFHQPLHYTTIDDVRRFMGNPESGALNAIRKSYYHLLRDVWPEDIASAFDDGYFDNPSPPYYYDSKSGGPT